MVPSFKLLATPGVQNIRLFSTAPCVRGKIRKILNLAASDDIYVKPTSKYEKFQKRARKVKAGEERTAANLRKQKVAHLLEKRLNENVDHKKLGATTNEDLKYFQHADKKMLCTLLGVTEEQVLDSVIVSKSVQAFLKRDQAEKAMTLAKLAKSKGVVAMNFIVAYFVQKGKIKTALDLHTMRKKWGVPLNDQSMTMLFDEISSYKPTRDEEHLTNTQAVRIKEIFLANTRKENYIPNLIHFNSCISALMKSNDQTPGMELFLLMDEIKIKPDIKTYTIVLQGLSYAKNDIWAVVNGLEVYERLIKVPEKQLDRHVLGALVRVFTSREKAYIVKKGIQLAQNCFDIPNDTVRIERFKRALPSQKGEKLEIRDFFTLDEKLKPTAALIDTVMFAASKVGDNKLAIKFFQSFEQGGFTSLIDRGLVHRYLTVSQLYDRKNAGETCLNIYKDISKSEQFSHIKLNEQTKYIIFNGMTRQANSNYDQENKRVKHYDKVKHVFRLIEEFMDMVEKPYNLKVFSGYLKAVHSLPLGDERRATVRRRLQVMKNYISGKSTKELNCTKAEILAFNKHLKHVEKRFAKEITSRATINITKEDLNALNV